MEAQILQENFAKALLLATRFTSSRAQLPVLTNVLITAKKNRLLISATNLEISISLSIGAKIEQEGSLTIPARVITDIVANLNPGQISLRSDRENLILSSEGFSSTISGMNAADFPSIPQKITDESLELPMNEFSQALSQVLFAVSQDETRPILTGSLLILAKNSLSLVATDGFRLCRKKIDKVVSKSNEKIIIPKSVLNEIVRLAEEEEKLLLSVRHKDNQIVFQLGSTIVSSRVLEGEFPDYEKIIPRESKLTIEMDKNDLLKAVKIASVFARDSANTIKFSVGEDYLEILAESQYVGQQKNKIEAKVQSEVTLKKEPFEIAFNYRFLEDFLNIVENDTVRMQFSEADTPGIFVDPADDSFLHLIMPVKLQAN